MPRRDPDALQMFRALRLNQGIGDVRRSVLIDADSWAQGGASRTGRHGRWQYVLGLDLGQNAAMSGGGRILARFTGRLEAHRRLPRAP